MAYFVANPSAKIPIRRVAHRDLANGFFDNDRSPQLDLQVPPLAGEDATNGGGHHAERPGREFGDCCVS